MDIYVTQRAFDAFYARSLRRWRQRYPLFANLWAVPPRPVVIFVCRLGVARFEL